MLRALMSVTSVSSLVCTPASALSVSRSAVTVVEVALSSWSRVCFDWSMSEPCDVMPVDRVLAVELRALRPVLS